jgi:hypothetical protein
LGLFFSTPPCFRGNELEVVFSRRIENEGKQWGGWYTIPSFIVEYSLSSVALTMALPVMEFQVQGYKIRKIFA